MSSVAASNSAGAKAEAPPREIIPSLADLSLDSEAYVSLLALLISEARYVQNNQRQGLIPQESRIAAHLLSVLSPHSAENGGPLIIETLE